MNPELETPEEDFAGGIEHQQNGVDPTKAKPEADPNLELRSAMAELAGTVKSFATASTPKAADPVLTEEQKAELWAIYNPEKSKPDFMKKFFRLNPEATPEEIKEAKELFADMQQGLVKQAIVGSRNIASQEFQKMRQEFAPILEYVAQARAEQTKNRFYEGYSSLNDPRYAKVIDATARLLAGQNFDSEASYFKALAEGAAETIKGVLPEFALDAKTTKPAANAPRLPRTSAGGTGGSGGGGSKEKAGSSDDDSGSIQW